mgnify:CR=1 FL=1
MKVKCIANSGNFLSEKRISLGDSKEYTRDYLKIGKIYNVYGIILSKDTLNYLVAEGSATLEPAEFFELVDNSMPPMWRYGYFGETYLKNESALYAVWGYKELTKDLNHNSDLAEGNEKALGIFLKRKFEIDEWEENNT